PPPCAIPFRVDHDGGDEPDCAHSCVHTLSHEVVVRISCDVVARDSRDRPQAVRNKERDKPDQQPVEPANERRDVGGLAPSRPSSTPGDVVDGHQSEWTGPVVDTCVWKNSSKTWSAAGAAAVPPWPPFSISAQTTSVGLSAGPYPHHHDWLKIRGYPSPGSMVFSAVPVLPAIGTGKP